MSFMLLKSATDVCCAGNNGLGQWIIEKVKECNEPELESTTPPQKPETQPQQTHKPENNNISFGGGKLSNKDAHFLNLTWSKLPLKAKKAAETLGWTEEQWNTEKWTNLEDYWYEDLSVEQKAAATELGWDAAAWDGQYEEQDWSDLPASAQKAAKVLGFTQQMWDDNEWPAAVEEAEWEDIAGEKKKALHVLGYNKWDWE